MTGEQDQDGEILQEAADSTPAVEPVPEPHTSQDRQPTNRAELSPRITIPPVSVPSLSPDLLATIDRIQQGFASLSPDLLATIDRINQAFAALKPFEDLVAAASRTADFQRWMEEHKEGIAILSAHGWWPHPNWPLRIIHNVVKLKRERRLGRLDRFICDTYDKDNFLLIKKAVRAWNVLPEYKERSRIFRAGLDAYMRRDYISAVSVWLPQVEGVLRARKERDGDSADSWKGTIETLGLETDSMIVGDFSRFFLALYESARETPPKKDLPIRRHAIFHGIDLTFGRPANAMRVFLTLDTVHYILLKDGSEAPVA